MNAETIANSKGPTRKVKFPWREWLAGTFENPVTLTFGKEIPASKSPAVFSAQLHQWAEVYKLWAFTSVNRGKTTTVAIYTQPRGKSTKRPDSKFPYPQPAKDTKKSPKKPVKKSAKKKPTKK